MRQSRFHNSVITEHFGKGELENDDDKNEKTQRMSYAVAFLRDVILKQRFNFF